MLETLMPALGLAALPVLGAIAAELLRIGGGQLLEDLNPAIAQCKSGVSGEVAWTNLNDWTKTFLKHCAQASMIRY